MPTITVLLRASHQLGSHRIEMNIAHQLQKIFIFLADNRLVSPLKKMSHLVVNPIEVLSVGLLQPLHEARKRHTRTLHEKVNMVGHQTVCIHHYPIPLTVARHSLQIGQVVPLGEKRPLPVIAAPNHVIEQTGSKQTKAACHALPISDRKQDCQY